MYLPIAVIQSCSSTSVDENIACVENLIANAAEQGAKWVVLPEYWAIMGQNETDKVKIAEDFGNGRLQSVMSAFAKRFNIVLFGGTIPLKSGEKGKVFNSLLTYDTMGECIYRYDKTHLFGFSGAGEKYSEADTISYGEFIPQFQYNGIKIAQGICYDLRFPEFFRSQGIFDILILPAAFTETTGKAHWTTLLKARAIENQCFVVAAGQGGEHANGRRTFGHSIIIDPWGEILAELDSNAGVAVANIDLNRIKTVRRHLPSVFNQRIGCLKALPVQGLETP